MITLEGHLSWSDAMKCTISKFMSNVRTSLYMVGKLKNVITLQVFDYLQNESVEGGVLDCL